MALQKDMEKGGNIFNYHIIDDLKISRVKGNISFLVYHYKSRDHYLANPSDFISREPVTISNGDGLTNAQVAAMTVFELHVLAYAKLKEPVLEPVINAETRLPELDGDNNPVMQNVNFYSDAVDVLETEDAPAS